MPAHPAAAPTWGEDVSGDLLSLVARLARHRPERAGMAADAARHPLFVPGLLIVAAREVLKKRSRS